MNDLLKRAPSPASLPRRAGRPTRVAEDGRAAILRGALEVFAEAGFRGASIAVIAKRAGVARPLVLYHFKTKDALWRHAVGQAYANMAADLMAFRQDVAELPPLALVAALARRAVSFAARHPSLTRLVVDEVGKPGPRATWLIENHVAPTYELANAVAAVLNAQPESALRPITPEHFIPILLGAMNFIFLDAPVMQRVFGIDVLDEAFVKRHGDYLAEIFMRGLLKGP